MIDRVVAELAPLIELHTREANVVWLHTGRDP